jgi:hypothetical protein
MDRLYRGNAEDAKRIRAMILFDDVMIIALITGQKPMKLMWNREVTRYDFFFFFFFAIGDYVFVIW